MNQQINAVRKTRSFILNLVADLTIDELNEVPEGFNNNIIWNLAHMVAAQQGICYVRPGLPTHITDAFFNSYKPGSKPEAKVDEKGVEEIKSLLFSTLDALEADLARGAWTSYPAWTTRYGNEIGSIEDAVSFLLFHEGLHTGYVMALKRVVKNKVSA